MVDKTESVKKQMEPVASQKANTESSLFSSPKARAALRKPPNTTNSVPAAEVVEELAEKVTPPNFVFQSLYLSDIEPNPFYNLGLKSEEQTPDRAKLLENFTRSFKEGQMTEFVALVRSHPQKNGKFQLVYGHLRLKAAGLAGLTYIGAVVRELTDDEMLMQLITENQHRVDFSKVELAAQIHHLREKFEWSYKALGEFFNLPLVTVYDLYYLSVAPIKFLQFVEQQPQFYHAISEMMRLDVTEAGQQIIWEFIQNQNPTPRQVREKLKSLLFYSNKRK